MKHVSLPILIAAILLFTVSCSRIDVTKPEGFAETRKYSRYKAVSPEGMIFGVRTVRNDPSMDLDFWAESLKNHLIKEGYKIISDGEAFEAGEREGILFEWAVPFGSENYIYLTAIIVSGGRIAIAEAGGEHTVYRGYRESLLESLGSLKLRY